MKVFKVIFSSLLVGVWIYVVMMLVQGIWIAKTKEKVQTVLENAYFEGQRDAINGDIRIRLNSDSVYIWVKSPWNTGEKPIFTPTRLDTK